MNLEDVLGEATTVAVVCTQWGDTGKGKFVDALAGWADIIARGTGGANAGHTICIDGVTYVFHLVPSGILRDGDGKLNVIGSGVAFDPNTFLNEVEVVEKAGLPTNHLYVAAGAHLVMPQHFLLDLLRESESSGKLGTTGRGIGPAYVDYYQRIGLTVNDALNPGILRAKLERNLAQKRQLIRGYAPGVVEDIMGREALGGGEFWQAGDFNVEAIIERYRAYGNALRDRVRDTDELVRQAVGKKKILLEGAQGNLLSVKYGSYPYVTASDCSVAGLAQGVGISERHVDLTLGIVKAFYMTRVGDGPFPTEMGGKRSEEWCDGSAEADENQRFPSAQVNHSDPFIQGIGVRRAGNEYGATTGRPRRVGWLDLPLLRYSKGFTGNHVILSKLDVLDECRTIRICHSYRYEGPDYSVGNCVLKAGEILTTANLDSYVLRNCVPLYKDFEGWMTPTSSVRTPEDLPDKLRQIVSYIEREADVKAVVLSVGPDRDQTIVNV